MIAIDRLGTIFRRMPHREVDGRFKVHQALAWCNPTIGASTLLAVNR
jgi:hypothetical protein